LTGWRVIRRDIAQDTQFEVNPDENEIYYIEVAAQQITSNRSESQLTTWIVIVALMGALFGAFIRTWSNRLNNQTSHTIAVVSLLFIFIPLVKISGNIGAFTFSTAVVDIIQALHRNLSEYDMRIGEPGRPALFSPPLFDENVRWDGQRSRQGTNQDRSNSLTDDNNEEEALIGLDHSAYQEVKNVQKWPSMAGYLGMIASWRSSKRITTKDDYAFSDRSPLTLLLFSAAFVYGGSYAPALCLSYFTPLVGFACRSLSWTVVMATWTISCALDFVFKKWIMSAKKLWRRAMVKDFVFSIFIVLIILMVQIGFLNSCWCRSEALTHSRANYIDLNPLTDADWNAGWWLWILTPAAALGLNVVLTLAVGVDGDNARTLLNRSSNMREQDIIRLNKRRRGLRLPPLEAQPLTSPNTTFDSENPGQPPMRNSEETPSNNIDGTATTANLHHSLDGM
jgi:hypothetical protein